MKDRKIYFGGSEQSRGCLESIEIFLLFEVLIVEVVFSINLRKICSCADLVDMSFGEEGTPWKIDAQFETKHNHSET